MPVAQGSERRRLTLAGYEGTDDPHASGAGYIRYHVMQLQIHLHERLLHVLDVRGRMVQQPLALPQVVP
jgi:hypothetical protein